MDRKLKWLIAAVVALIVAVPFGTYVYINVIRDDPPAKLTLDDATTTTLQIQAGSTSTTTGSSPNVNPGELSGTWTPTNASQVGYRVSEILFGQDTIAVGRTNQITGKVSISGTNVTAAEFTVDMASIKSDQSNRDGQFRGRIMSTSEFPTATFKLSQPVNLPRLPDTNAMTFKVTGTLTLHGVTKTVTTDLQIKLTNGTLAANGTIPIEFRDWNIPDPSFGPAQTEDHGELEILLVLSRT